MTKVTLTLPESLEVAIRGEESIFTPSASIPESILVACIAYGWQQKNADAAASAARIAADEEKVSDDAFTAWRKDEANAPAIAAKRREMIEASITARLEGDWTTRAAASPRNALDDYRVAIVLGMIRKAPESPVAKAYAAIPSDDQKARRAFRLDIAAKNAAVIDPLAVAEMERDAALADAVSDATLSA